MSGFESSAEPIFCSRVETLEFDSRISDKPLYGGKRLRSFLCFLDDPHTYLPQQAPWFGRDRDIALELS